MEHAEQGDAAVAHEQLEAHARTCTSKHAACAQGARGDAPVLDQHGHLAVPRNRDQSKPADMSLASENYTMTAPDWHKYLHL